MYFKDMLKIGLILLGKNNFSTQNLKKKKENKMWFLPFA